MPDRRAHRGPHPEDHELFAHSALPSLRAATYELSWLLGRIRDACDIQHAQLERLQQARDSSSALKVVGDRYQLRARQRAAVLRATCPDARAAARRSRELQPEQLRGQTLCIDGFNVLTTLEVALSGGVLLLGRDGVMRDIAGVHGSYQRVTETEGALHLLAKLTQHWGLSRCEIYLDSPVSNSGRLRAFIAAFAEAHGLPFEVFVVTNPDTVLMASPHVVASADSQMLDGPVRWLSLARRCVAHGVPGANTVDLSHPADSAG